MRILYIHTSNIWGGATVALYRILLAMKNRGHDVYVVTNKSEGPFLEKLDSVGIKHFEHRLSLTIYPKVKNPLKIYDFYEKTVKKLVKDEVKDEAKSLVEKME